MKNTHRGMSMPFLIGGVVVLAVVIIAVVSSGGKDEREIAVEPSTTTPVKDDGDKMMKGDDKMMMKDGYSVVVKNVSADQPLSPGVVVVHDSTASINFLGKQGPKELEPLAEVGDPKGFATLVKGLPGVLEVQTFDEPVLPGQMTTVMVGKTETPAYVSVITMAVGSNDGYALVDKLKLAAGEKATGENHDAGTEENTALLSGFAGGQPDPAQGAANVDNGTATTPQANIVAHPQLTTPLLEVMVNGGHEGEDVMMKEGEAMEKDAMKDGDAMKKSAGSYQAYSAEKVAAAGGAVVFFHASWCPSCQSLNADIEKNAANIPAGTTILKADYDKETALKQKYGVTTQHTLVQVDAQGNLIQKWSGGNTLAALTAKVK